MTKRKRRTASKAQGSAGTQQDPFEALLVQEVKRRRERSPFFFRPQAPSQTIEATMIDSAAADHEYSEYWADADYRSAVEFLTDDYRRRMNARCRKIYVNDGYTIGGSASKANFQVGPAVKLVLGNEPIHQRVMERWNRWTKLTRFWPTIRLAVKMLVPDGEFFLRKTWDNAIPGTGYRIEEIDPLLVETPPYMALSENVAGGIEYNAKKQPVRYYVRKVPINGVNMRWNDYESIPADQIIHFYQKTFPNQLRGMPLLQSVLRVISGKQSYNYSTIDAADLAARPGLILQNNLPENTAEDLGPAGFMKLNEMFDLPRGGGIAVNNATVSQIKPEYPANGLQWFVPALLTEQGAAMQMPRNMITNDSSGYNYSSGKLDFRSFFRNTDCDRYDYEQVVFDPTFEEWLTLDAQINDDSRQLLEAANGNAWEAARTWIYDPLPEIDAEKEYRAKEIGLRTGLTTIRRELQKQGIDPEPHMAEIERELKYRLFQPQTTLAGTVNEQQPQEGGTNEFEP